jgi:hypothetical protein
VRHIVKSWDSVTMPWASTVVKREHFGTVNELGLTNYLGNSFV